MAENNKALFDELTKVNVNEHTDLLETGRKDKDGNPVKLTYLSWSWAIDYITKKCPDFSYEIKMFDDESGKKVPFVFDESTGYMVFTSVTINNTTKEMWMPVLDANNFAMLNHAYQVKTKFREYNIYPATMSDINKAIMRCLVKNIAMFGLGLYIYQKEGVPDDMDPTQQNKNEDSKKPEEKSEKKKLMSEEEKAERCSIADALTSIDPKAMEKLRIAKKVETVDQIPLDYLRFVYNKKFPKEAENV